MTFKLFTKMHLPLFMCMCSVWAQWSWVGTQAGLFVSCQTYIWYQHIEVTTAGQLAPCSANKYEIPKTWHTGEWLKLPFMALITWEILVTMYRQETTVFTCWLQYTVQASTFRTTLSAEVQITCDHDIIYICYTSTAPGAAIPCSKPESWLQLYPG